ncbi:hypothetical protein CANCADRAFT_42351 [Tortispora caseinolytica NRRL Y-17796]|uniref:Uncharacterized protein n=1 Tax=Tortispora caseinolytica NRRL Y-17796 TaxID=767744 RepID=A0A1E4TIY0_9ASCO|nr:hypothetical protein CANCADRAFT_42351 [Tortispora caseinolytica NRRL Y-17796]
MLVLDDDLDRGVYSDIDVEMGSTPSNDDDLEMDDSPIGQENTENDIEYLSDSMTPINEDYLEEETRKEEGQVVDETLNDAFQTKYEPAETNIDDLDPVLDTEHDSVPDVATDVPYADQFDAPHTPDSGEPETIPDAAPATPGESPSNSIEPEVLEHAEPDNTKTTVEPAATAEKVASINNDDTLLPVEPTADDAAPDLEHNNQHDIISDSRPAEQSPDPNYENSVNQDIPIIITLHNTTKHLFPTSDVFITEDLSLANSSLLTLFQVCRASFDVSSVDDELVLLAAPLGLEICEDDMACNEMILFDLLDLFYELRSNDLKKNVQSVDVFEIHLSIRKRVAAKYNIVADLARNGEGLSSIAAAVSALLGESRSPKSPKLSPSLFTDTPDTNNPSDIPKLDQSNISGSPNLSGSHESSPAAIPDDDTAPVIEVSPALDADTSNLDTHLHPEVEEPSSVVSDNLYTSEQVEEVIDFEETAISQSSPIVTEPEARDETSTSFYKEAVEVPNSSYLDVDPSDLDTDIPNTRKRSFNSASPEPKRVATGS